MTEVWQEPVRGMWAHPALTRLSGVEVSRGYVDGRFPLPPVGHLTGLRPTDAGLSHSTFALPVTRWLLDATGFLQPATAALVSDAPLGSAFANSLPAGKVCTTSELTVNYLRPAGLDAERLLAHAEVIKSGRQTGLTQARVVDANGRLLAHATSRLVVLDVPIDHETPLPEPTPPADTPDPWQREPVGEIADWSRLLHLSGREVFDMWLADALPRPPIAHLIGLRPLHCTDESVAFAMPTSSWLRSPGPYLYGGATALLADAALTSAVMPALPPATLFRPLDLRLRFIRPILPDTGDLTAEAGVAHRGRSLAVTRGEIRTADGKVAVLAESSILLRPTGS